MSFVFAEKVDNIFHIYCDTKISFEHSGITPFSDEQKKLIEKYGIVKTTIICPTVSISFAGNNIFLASKLFRTLYEMGEFEVDEALEAAWNIHKESTPNDIEFIIASCENQIPVLHCIKDRTVQKDCDFCWIGSAEAHNQFQKYRNERVDGKVTDRTGDAFLDVVNGCPDPSVGGFPILTEYYGKSISYSNRALFQMSKSQIVMPGKDVIWYLDAKDGGYSLTQIPISCEELMLDIEQMESKILYARIRRYRESRLETFSLMLPMLVRHDGLNRWVIC